MLRKIWSSKNISINTKMRIFTSSVKQVMLYGSDLEDNKTHNTQAANIHQHLSQENPTHLVEKNKPGSH